MRSVHLALIGFAGSAAILVTGNPARAHFKLVEPASIWVTEDGGEGSLPCGDGYPSEAVTKARGGHELTVKINEFVPHPSHYRIALSVRSLDELPPDPEVVVDGRNRSVSAAVQDPPKPPILADGLFPHEDTPPYTEWIAEVTLPNLDCELCTLQVIQFMADHGPTRWGGYSYHHCADLQITADPDLPPADEAWFRLPRH